MEQLAFSQMEAESEIPFKTPTDTLSDVKRHSPKKAALLSAVLPGAGQIYNKKYWKLPIVYAGLGGLGTWVGLNAVNLRGFTNAYILEVDGDSLTTGSYKGFSGANQLSIKRDDAKRGLDLSIILLSVYYALHILDAAVDAHLFDYTITEELSVSWQPDFNLYQAYDQMRPKLGVNVSMNFHQKK
jgi:hypothetical protein